MLEPRPEFGPKRETFDKRGLEIFDEQKEDWQKEIILSSAQMAKILKISEVEFISNLIRDEKESRSELDIKDNDKKPWMLKENDKPWLLSLENRTLSRFAWYTMKDLLLPTRTSNWIYSFKKMANGEILCGFRYKELADGESYDDANQRLMKYNEEFFAEHPDFLKKLSGTDKQEQDKNEELKRLKLEFKKEQNN